MRHCANPESGRPSPECACWLRAFISTTLALPAPSSTPSAPLRLPPSPSCAGPSH